MNTVVASQYLGRPADTTAYAAKDVITTGLAITAATNAAPIVITAAAHGLVTGDRVTILAVGGNTAANADWVVTVLSSSTFSLNGSAGNGAYTSGGTIQKMFTLFNVARVGGTGTIRSVLVAKNGTGVTNASIRVLIFNAPVTLPADNAALAALVATNIGVFVGYVDLTLVAESDGAVIQSAPLAIPFKCAQGDRNLYAVITAEGAYTPASGEGFTLRVGVEKD